MYITMNGSENVNYVRTVRERHIYCTVKTTLCVSLYQQLPFRPLEESD